MKRRMSNKIVAMVLAFLMLFCSGTVSFANSDAYSTATSVDAVEPDSTLEDTTFAECMDLIEDVEGVEIESVDVEIVQGENVDELYETLTEGSDAVEEADVSNDDFSALEADGEDLTADDEDLTADDEDLATDDEDLLNYENNDADYSLLADETGVTVLNVRTNEYTHLSITSDGNLEIVKVESGQDDTMIVNRAIIEVLEEDAVEGQGWKSVVKETYKKKYWYQNSDTGKYVRVGNGSGRYKINYDKLSNSKADNVAKYRKKVKRTKNKWNNFKDACISAGLSAPLVTAAFIAAFGAAPETAGVSLLIGVILGLAVGVTWDEAYKIATNYISAKKAYKVAKNLYPKVKKYGSAY